MRLLLAEDERDLSHVVSAILKHDGYEVDVAENGQEAEDLARSKAYDCMIFDIMMPVKDGITALQELRKEGNITPIIMLTAKAEVDDRIAGLDAGADDYLAKPFSMGELLARIRSLTRRKSPSFTPTVLKVEKTQLNTEEQELSCVNSIRLNNQETKLLNLLFLNINKPQTTDFLFSHVWENEKDESPDVVWIYISYLRDKLKAIQSDLYIEGSRSGPFTLKPKEP